MWPFSEIKKLQQALALANETNVQSVKNFESMHKVSQAQDGMIALLQNGVEVERMRVVACGVAAMANTRQSAQMQRVGRDSPYYCASVQDVYDAVDREMLLREQNESYVRALTQLAVLGNGERPGNSDGNVIAQRALAKYASTKTCLKCGCDMIKLESEDKKICSNGACDYEIEWKLEPGQKYQHKRDVEPFVEDRSVPEEPRNQVRL